MILMLGGMGDSTRAVYHHLSGVFGSIPAIIEAPVSSKAMILNRARKLGYPSVISQLLFMKGIRPVLERTSRKRRQQLRSQFDYRPIPDEFLHRVPSVNSPETIQLIAAMKPRVIVVNGTRIISKRTLASTDAIFLNTHAGITPRYRGAHGGYWALLNNDQTHCGVTVHLVDEGIDTGNVIAQAVISPSAEDNFTTYPYLQLSAGLPLLVQAVKDALDGSLVARQVDGPSNVFYHPGALQYLRGRLHGVR